MSTENQPDIRILIVEDMAFQADTLKRTIEETLDGVDITIEQDFQKASAALEPHKPYEAVVLDLWEGESPDTNAGERIWEKIWKKRYMPVIIHTGHGCDVEPPVPEDDPFIKCFQKEEGSDEMVANHLLSVRPHILALREVENEFNITMRHIVRNVAPHIWQVEADDQARQKILVRSARRRLAAMMDMNTISTDEQLASWEQYVYPPVEPCLLMGDILQVSGGDSKDPSSYRLLLTPSCDLQKNKNGVCKASSLLVAKCTNISEYMKVFYTSTSPKKPEEVIKKLTQTLTEPHLGGFVPLPEYKSVLPCMAANLRHLELIPIEDVSIAEEEKKFGRVASVDSPFREFLSWAFLQVTGRPGVPERDRRKWAEEILQAASQDSTTGSTPQQASLEPKNSTKDKA